MLTNKGWEWEGLEASWPKDIKFQVEGVGSRGLLLNTVATGNNLVSGICTGERWLCEPHNDGCSM